MKFSTRLRMEALEDRALLAAHLPYYENFYTCHAPVKQPECSETPSAAAASTSGVPTNGNCTPNPSCPTNGQTYGAGAKTTEICQPKTTCEVRTDSSTCVPKTVCQKQTECTYQPSGKSDNCVPRETYCQPKNCEPTTAPAAAKTSGEGRWNENCRPTKNCDTVPQARSSGQRCEPKSSETCVPQKSNCDSGATVKKSSDRCEMQEQRRQSSRNERCAEPVQSASSRASDSAYADQQWLARLLRA